MNPEALTLAEFRVMVERSARVFPERFGGWRSSDVTSLRFSGVVVDGDPLERVYEYYISDEPDAAPLYVMFDAVDANNWVVTDDY